MDEGDTIFRTDLARSLEIYEVANVFTATQFTPFIAN